ncbi:MAG: peptide chain release factor 1 [Deltaproteobacteria bacterium]|nr:peptide chain release factor 1 [Deltaproteobacteria bacterium]
MAFEHVQSLQERYDALTTQLADPATSANAALYQRLTKELAGLRPTIETYAAYRRCAAELAAAKALGEAETDPAMRALAKEESAQLTARLATLADALEALLAPTDPNEERNVILEIRAGTGGEEAALFAAALYRMYQRYAESKRWRVETMDSNATDLGGLKEIIALISGAGAYGAFRFESGVHRVQRVPRTETAGRIHTSAVTVAVLPEADDVAIQIDDKDLKIDVFRASGPGGQGVNTTDSAVRITHLPSGVVVTCRDERSQHKNRAKAMKILRARLHEQEEEALAASERATRRAQVGTGDRSEKIRTYNFPQNRVTDHRIGLTLHQLDRVLEGGLDPLIDALRKTARAERIP